MFGKNIFLVKVTIAPLARHELYLLLLKREICTRNEFVPEMSCGLNSKSMCKTETLASDERPRFFLKKT